MIGFLKSPIANMGGCRGSLPFYATNDDPWLEMGKNVRRANNSMRTPFPFQRKTKTSQPSFFSV